MKILKPKYLYSLISLLVSLFYLNTINAQTVWTSKDQEKYIIEKQDSTKWFMKLLEIDLMNVKSDTSKIKFPLTDYPSPVPKYEGNGSTLRPLKLNINRKRITGYTLAHYKDEYNKHLFKDSIGEHEYRTFFNILIYTDTPLQTDSRVVSRNYPHYFNTGTQHTSLGKIDWVQMTLANMENFAIVTQRYFDLNLGRTILVAPYKDGSVRILQIKDSPEIYTWKEIKSGFVKTINDFISRIEKNQEVIDFFSNSKIID